MGRCHNHRFRGRDLVPLRRRRPHGQLLEAKQNDWGVANETLLSLEERFGRGPSKLDPQAKENRGWSLRWKLYLPETEEEVLSWTS